MRKCLLRVLCPIIFCAAVPAQQQFPNTCSGNKIPHFPSSTATAIDQKCGLPGEPDPKHPGDGPQNEAKNNFCADSTPPKQIKLANIASLQSETEKQETQLRLTPGEPPANRTFLKTLGEGNRVVFEGFVFEARQECKETVNCGKTVPNVNASHDIHISLVEQPRRTKPGDPKLQQDSEECTSFVAEMIPHHRPAQWTACNVNAVAAKGLRVRVIGQQFFDGSHLPCKNGAPQGTNPKRISLWEIHPIYSFEVCPQGDCASGGWLALEQFAASNRQPCPETKCTE